MGGEEGPPSLKLRRAIGYGEFRHPYQEAPHGSAGSFTQTDARSVLSYWNCIKEMS